MSSQNHQVLWDSYFPEFVAHKDKGIELLMACANLVTILSGQQVFYAGSQCQNYLLVLTGAVKVQILSERGREVLLYHVQSGDSCVLTTSCLLSGDNYPAEGITESDVLAFSIPSHAFYRSMEQSAFFREFVFKNFSVRLSKIIGRMESVVLNTIDQRISKALLESGETTLTKTHSELAYELGTAREVISRHLKIFESQGLINLKRGVIEIVDRRALSQT
ncbi:MAG: Crp/Fnr family transcriptional regulator [Methylococcales bacterium]|nr:Crp/Fnr family transcriptional regulator [Methylococcales bacterium]